MIDTVSTVGGVASKGVCVYNMFTALAVSSIARLAEFGCFGEAIFIFMCHFIVVYSVATDHILDVRGSTVSYDWGVLEDLTKVGFESK